MGGGLSEKQLSMKSHFSIRKYKEAKAASQECSKICKILF